MYTRVSIYLDAPELREHIKVAAARRGVSVSEYCLAAVRTKLTEDGVIPPGREAAAAAAEGLDRLRKRVGPVGVPVRELIDEGRR